MRKNQTDQSGFGHHPVALGVLVSLCMGAPAAWGASAALVDPACDANQDGIVDNLPADYAEGQQYGNMLNFYAVSMGSSPLHAPAPLAAWSVDGGLELSYIPSLKCTERAVFGGYKTEHTNRSPVLPRLHLDYGLPGGVYVGLNIIPPVPAVGVTTTELGGELGIGERLGEHLELGARGTLFGSHVVGDLAGPLPPNPAKNDTFTDLVWSVEGMAGLWVPMQDGGLTPYLGAGYTRVSASMHIGEDNVDVPGAQKEMGRMAYRGPHGEIGAELTRRRIKISAEAYVVPLNLVDPGNPRLFISPRLWVGGTIL